MKINELVFKAKFPKYCDLEKCGGRCCKGGVWADLREKEIIMNNSEAFLPFMRPETRNPNCWFGETAHDADCPSGVAIETNVVGDSCVFSHPKTGCALQVAAARQGLHEWKFKPLFCIMFPLVVCENELTVDEDMEDVWCMEPENRTHPILPAMVREVNYLFPQDVVRKLLPG
jgi:hypothetical protein